MAVIVHELERLDVERQAPLAGAVVLFQPPFEQAIQHSQLFVWISLRSPEAYSPSPWFTVWWSYPRPLRLLYPACSSVIVVEPGSMRSCTMSARVLPSRYTSIMVTSGSSPVAR